MRKAFVWLFLVMGMVTKGQEKVSPTNLFTVKGDVKEARSFTLEDVSRQPVHPIGDIVITNHAGEAKGTAKAMQGVRLKDLLASVELTAENPRLNSTYYFVMKASDGYTVVFSWNEIFNTAVGDKLFIVTQKDGKALAEMPDRLLLISAADIRTGRRFVKGLAEIIVKKVS